MFSDDEMDEYRRSCEEEDMLQLAEYSYNLDSDARDAIYFNIG